MAKKKKKDGLTTSTAEKNKNKTSVDQVVKEDECAKQLDYRELLPLVVLLVLELFFWRNIIFTDNLLGDLGDGRFTALSAEHWWKFLTGREKFSVIPVYYPNEIAIGYSDMHLGLGLIHSVFRLFGADIFLAFKLACFSIHVLGLAHMPKGADLKPFVSDYRIV